MQDRYEDFMNKYPFPNSQITHSSTNPAFVLFVTGFGFAATTLDAKYYANLDED